MIRHYISSILYVGASFVFSAVFSTTLAEDDAYYHNQIRKALSHGLQLNFGFGDYDFAQIRRPKNSLPELQVDPVLEASAKAHAQHCVFAHSSTGYGENLFASSGVASVERAVNSWSREIGFYDYDSGACAAGQMCGHYTQVIWENTTKVGCATQICSPLLDAFGQPLFSATLVVCQYNPPGNFIGTRPYRAGDEPNLEDLSAIKSNTVTSSARFLGGAWKQGELTTANTFHISDHIHVGFRVQVVDTEDDSQERPLYVAAQVNDEWFMRDALGQWLPWKSGVLHDLVSIGTRKLESSEVVTVIDDLTNLAGVFNVYVAYQQASGVFVYNKYPLSFTVYR